MELAHKVSSQHRIIDSLLSGVQAAIARGDAARAKGRLTGLRRALEAHFVLEEDHYFPVKRGERPDLEGALDDLVEEHVRIREDLERISVRLDGGEWDDAKRLIASLDARFHRHEELEGKLLRA